jgi:hypothetical protein
VQSVALDEIFQKQNPVLRPENSRRPSIRPTTSASASPIRVWSTRWPRRAGAW